MAAALANSVVFFGTNRLTTIFVALSSILAYCLAFPRHRLRLFLLASFVPISGIVSSQPGGGGTVNVASDFDQPTSWPACSTMAAMAK